VFTRFCGILLAGSVFAACSNSGATSQNVLPVPNGQQNPITVFATTTHISHVTVVIMENDSYEQIIGSSAAPYTNSLARANALFTNSHGVTHPSQPNYLALFSGSTQGVTSDTCPVSFGAANLATELLSHGLTFQGYAENWPSSGNPCYGTYSSSVGSHYLYWRKHIPWSDFTNVAYRTYGHLYSGPGAVLAGTVNFVVPNICDDMHDCSIAAGDAWLSKNVPAIQNYDSTHNGLLIVTFDEGEYSSTNHIVTIMIGPMVVKGTYSQSINHYNVLRLIESNLGLPLLGNSASAQAISGVIH
jgi:acid phosphatase